MDGSPDGRRVRRVALRERIQIVLMALNGPSFSDEIEKGWTVHARMSIFSGLQSLYVRLLDPRPLADDERWIPLIEDMEGLGITEGDLHADVATIQVALLALPALDDMPDPPQGRRYERELRALLRALPGATVDWLFDHIPRKDAPSTYNVRCHRCDYPLGVRPGSGPRGEPPPAYWFARVSLSDPIQQVLLQFEMPRGAGTLAVHFIQLAEALAIAGGSNASLDDDPAQFLRVVGKLTNGKVTQDWSEVEGVVGDRRISFAASPEPPSLIPDEQVVARARRVLAVPDKDALIKELWAALNIAEFKPEGLWAWWVGRLGVVSVKKWKNQAHISTLTAQGVFRSIATKNPPAHVPVPIYYMGAERRLRRQALYVPADATTLPDGIEIRCPKCNAVGRIGRPPADAPSN